MSGAVLLAVLAASSFAASRPRSVGDGAQRLVSGALRQARQEWREDACFAGLAAEVNCPVKPMGPGTRSGRITTFAFRFWSPATKGSYEVFYTEAEGPPPLDPETVCPLDRYYGGRPAGAQGPCVTEMSVDSDEALGIGLRHGVPEGGDRGLSLHLAVVNKTKGGQWKRAAGGGAAWFVSAGAAADRPALGHTVVLDAKTGRVLAKGDNAVLARGAGGSVELRYPVDKPGRNFCSSDVW